MHARYRVIETTTLDDGSKRYRVVDLVEGGSASKHGVFKVRVEADAVCLLLNTEHPRASGVSRASASS
ncbi:hypothetical protein EQV97_17470 [Pseudomonas sp. TMW22090]|nr:hypothetical protein [Pseudomonas sp. TMW22090]